MAYVGNGEISFDFLIIAMADELYKTRSCFFETFFEIVPFQLLTRHTMHAVLTC